jgi:putative ABC transport system substrate-binding protein
MSTSRRDFITLLGVAAWPLAARAQQGDRVRRIGVLMPYDENDPEAKLRHSAFTQALAELGWTDGRNVRIDLRWGGGDLNQIRALAQELVGLQPDIIVTNSGAVTIALQRETRSIPIVFASPGDPVAIGIVPRLDHPGGNATGFASLEATMGGKWLELLSEIAPGLRRAAIINPFNPDASPALYMPSLETAARSLKVVMIPAPVRSDAEIENGDQRPWARTGRRSCSHAGSVDGRASRTDYISGGPKQRTGGLLSICLCQRGRFALLRRRPSRQLSSCRLLCRSHSAWRKAGGASRSISD